MLHFFDLIQFGKARFRIREIWFFPSSNWGMGGLQVLESGWLAFLHDTQTAPNMDSRSGVAFALYQNTFFGRCHCHFSALLLVVISCEKLYV